MEQEPKLENHAPERGLLDLSVALSTRDITAGNQFALFVLVRNPFNKPVWIRRVHVSLPSELKLADPGSLSKKQRRKQGLKRHEVAEDFERKLNEKDQLDKEKEHLKAQRVKLQAKFDILSQRLEEILSDSQSNPSDDVERRLFRLEKLIQNLKREIEYLTEQEYSSERIAFNMSGDRNRSGVNEKVRISSVALPVS